MLDSLDSCHYIVFIDPLCPLWPPCVFVPLYPYLLGLALTKALNQFVVNEFFDMLTEVIEEYNILPGNLYNMDKKCIQLGIGARITAMIDQDKKLSIPLRMETGSLLQSLKPSVLMGPFFICL